MTVLPRVNNVCGCGAGFDGSIESLTTVVPADGPVRALTGEWCLSPGHYVAALPLPPPPPPPPGRPMPRANLVPKGVSSEIAMPTSTPFAPGPGVGTSPPAVGGRPTAPSRTASPPPPPPPPPPVYSFA